MRYQYPPIRNAEDFWKAEGEAQHMEAIATGYEGADFMATQAEMICVAVRLRDVRIAIKNWLDNWDGTPLADPPEYPSLQDNALEEALRERRTDT